VTGIGAPGTPGAPLWHEIAARNGVICPYGPHNLTEWNHCQPTWVKIILADNPLRETVTAEGPISLEDMFEVGDWLIAASHTVEASEPSAHFFKPPHLRIAIAVAPQTNIASKRLPTTPSTFEGYPMRWPPLSGVKVGWPKGVPRIARLDDKAHRPTSPTASSTLVPKPTLISVPRVLAEYSVGRGVIPSTAKDVKRPRQPRSRTKGPISAELARTCRALAIKAHPTQRAGSKTTSAQAQPGLFSRVHRNPLPKARLI
jgi:hypothetical protein